MRSLQRTAMRAFTTTANMLTLKPVTKSGDDVSPVLDSNPSVVEPTAGDVHDGFLTVFGAGKNSEVDIEDEQYALVCTNREQEAVTGAVVNAEPVEDQTGVPSAATCRKFVMAMTESELSSYCAKVYLPRREMGHDELRAHYRVLVIGFQVLTQCAHEWNNHINSVATIRENIMRILHHLSGPRKWCVARLIEKLLRCEDWVKHDIDVVELGDFEVSAALWLFKVGVEKLALAVVQPCPVLELVLAQEQEWLLQDTAEEEMVELHGLVADLHAWGSKE